MASLFVADEEWSYVGLDDGHVARRRNVEHEVVDRAARVVEHK
jgi:hypothetical protein